MEKSYRELLVWKKAFHLTKQIYSHTDTFPSKEHYRLTSQMCRAAISVTANIAEGSCRGSDKDYARFLYMARGSAAELENYIFLAVELGYLSPGEAEPLKDQIGQIGRMLNSLIKYLEKGSVAGVMPSSD